MIDMFDGLYRRRLLRDLPVWREKGWVTSEGATAIRSELAAAPHAVRVPAIIAFLGAVLLAFAAMTFVAANWNDIARPLRFGLLAGAMAAAYLVAWWLTRRGHDLFADAAVLVGTAAYGAAIMLVAQIYHIEARFPDGVALWGAGALLAAWLLESRAALMLAIAVLTYWSGLETAEYGWRLHWPFLFAWAAFIAIVETGWRSDARSWPAARHLIVLSGLIWAAVTLISLANQGRQFDLAVLSLAVPLLALGWGLAWLLLAAPSPRLNAYGTVLRPYALAGLLATLFLLQFGDDGSYLWRWWIGATFGLALASAALALAASRRGLLGKGDAAAIGLVALGALPAALLQIWNGGAANDVTVPVLWAVPILLAAVWAAAMGQRRQHRASLTIGLVAFGAEVVYLYFETFGTLLDTALFFLIGGLLLMALAALLYRLHRRLAQSPSADAVPGGEARP